MAHGSFSLIGGARTTLTLKLNAAGKALLSAATRLRLDVAVAAHDSYGDPLTKTLAVTLKR